MKRILVLILVALVGVGCAKAPSINLEKTYFSLKPLDKVNAMSDPTGCTFESEDPFVASVDEYTGAIKALHVGRTDIHITSKRESASITVQVLPRYDVFGENDPFLGGKIKFGDEKYLLNREMGWPEAESDETMTYLVGDAKEGDSIIGIMYMFENNELSSVLVLTNNNHFEKVCLHLAEKYQYVGEIFGAYTFCNALTTEEATMGIVYKKVSGVWSIIYTPTN